MKKQKKSSPNPNPNPTFGINKGQLCKNKIQIQLLGIQIQLLGHWMYLVTWNHIQPAINKGQL